MIISFDVRYGFPDASCRVTVQIFGNDDTGNTCDAVVVIHAHIAYNAKCPEFAANVQTSGIVIIDDTVCVSRISITSTQAFTMRIETHKLVPPSKLSSKFLATSISPESVTILQSALPPMSMNIMFHGSSVIFDGFSIPTP